MVVCGTDEREAREAEQKRRGALFCDLCGSVWDRPTGSERWREREGVARACQDIGKRQQHNARWLERKRADGDSPSMVVGGGEGVAGWR